MYSTERGLCVYVVVLVVGEMGEGVETGYETFGNNIHLKYTLSCFRGRNQSSLTGKYYLPLTSLLYDDVYLKSLRLTKQPKIIRDCFGKYFPLQSLLLRAGFNCYKLIKNRGKIYYRKSTLHKMLV